MRHLIDIMELSTQEIKELIDRAMDIIANPDKYAHVCDRKKLATLFFEPSTRTRLSFEAAMYWALPLLRLLLPPRARAFLIPLRWFPAMRTSSQCVIPRKALPW